MRRKGPLVREGGPEPDHAIRHDGDHQLGGGCAGVVGTDPSKRRGFVAESQVAVSAQHDRRPFSLLCVDLDHFNEINETRGHDAGDLLLKEVAERLRTLVRETDTVARLGGDEFAVLVQGREPAQAIHMAERIEAALKVPYLAAPDITVSASVGNR